MSALDEAILLDYEEPERRIFRKVIFLLFLFIMVAVIVSVAKKMAGMAGGGPKMTEADVRAKFDDKVAPRVGEERASGMADKVVDTMRAKGKLIEDEGAAEESGDEDAASAEDDEPAGDADEPAGEDDATGDEDDA